MSGPVSPEVRRGQREAFRRRIQLLLHFDDFAGASSEVFARPRWQTDPEALRQLGDVVLRLASRSSDRSSTYEAARRLYRRAASLAGDSAIRAEMTADVASAYLEEGRTAAADAEYARGLTLDPADPGALLGRLAVACAGRNADRVRGRCGDLTTRRPLWHQERDVVERLVTDPRYAFLRASVRLFVECFGGSPEDIRGLYCVQRVATLRENVCDGKEP